ncbi:hypothetical protein LJR009_005544 [Bosea sp. LjRoot9]|uniref:hypothetical protein n=1 Tax=Bosea sp. LjRoot9 TaxID=3342341 RepID=UPI003ED0C239
MVNIRISQLNEPSSFVVGLDDTGHWVAVETHGRGGGIFTDRKTALRYAEFETGHRANAVRFSRTPLQLTL